MKKRLISFFTIAMMLCSLTVNSTAADNTPSAVASHNLSSYMVALSASGDEEMLISMSVDGVGIQEKIGVYEITIEQKVNGEWTLYDIMDSFDHPDFFSYDSYDHMGAITFDGEAGTYFRVTLFVYARDAETSDSGYVSSPAVLCER